MSPIEKPEVGTFEARDEREELCAAFAQVVAERGFDQTTIEAVVERAGMERAVFDRYFVDLADCMRQAFIATTEQCFTVMAQGYLGSSGTWADASYAAVEAFFRFCMGTPAFLYALVVELPYGGEAVLALKRRAFAMMTEFVKPAFAQSGPEPGFPGDERVFAQIISGGIWEIFRTHAEEDRIGELMEALPGVGLVGLAPIVGREEALRVIRDARGSGRSD